MGSNRIRFGRRDILKGATATAALLGAARASLPAGAFAQGRPLLAHACGAPVTLAAGPQHLQVLGGVFAVDNLRLRSPAPAPTVVSTTSSVGLPTLG